MIRLFTVLYKTNFSKVPSGIELFNSVVALFKLTSAPCAKCGTHGSLEWHNGYKRYNVEYDGDVIEHIVWVKRVICKVCKRTHAILPDILVPYNSYNIIFILRVLKEYFHTRAVTAISNKYRISASTLYAWRDRYLVHATLDLGVIVEAALISSSHWLSNAFNICRTNATHDFYRRFGFSFLEYKKTARFSSA